MQRVLCYSWSKPKELRPHSLHLQKARSWDKCGLWWQNSTSLFCFVLFSHIVYSNEDTRTAVMTDSYTWELFHIDQELGLYRSQFVADSKQSRLRILSIVPQVSMSCWLYRHFGVTLCRYTSHESWRIRGYNWKCPCFSEEWRRIWRMSLVRSVAVGLLFCYLHYVPVLWVSYLICFQLESWSKCIVTSVNGRRFKTRKLLPQIYPRYFP